MKSGLMVFFFCIAIAPSVRASDMETPAKNVADISSEYADVLALDGTAKQEILAIARILRAKPELAIDRTAASGEFCLKSSNGTMVHFASDASVTKEDIVYEFDASELIQAGLDPNRLATLTSLGSMEPGRWYFLALGIVDPHHKHAMPTPTIAIAVNVK